MSFRNDLNRLLRIWHISAGVTIACFIGTVLGLVFLMQDGNIGGLHPLGVASPRIIDPFKCGLWLLHVGPDCCLLSAVVALAAGTSYLLGKRLPDFACLIPSP